MLAKLDAIRERLHKLVLVREIAASHRLDQMNHLRLQKKLTTWRRNNCCERNETLAVRQRRTQGRVCSVDNPGHFESKVYFELQRPPSPQEFTGSMWADVNRLREKILPPQSPQSDFSSRRSAARPPPQQLCSVSRVVVVNYAVEPETEDKDKRWEIPLLV